MTDKPHNESSPIGTLTSQMTVARASGLARAGRYQEAEALIEQELGRQRERPDLLDLFARIHAQQNHWNDAERAWTQALALDPTNETYKAGLKRVSQMRKRPLAFFWKPAMLGLSVVLIFLCGLASGRLTTPPSKPEVNGASSLTPTLLPSPWPTATGLPLPSPTLTLTASPLPPTVSPTATSVTCKVSTDLRNGMLNIRSEPRSDSSIVGWLSEGEPLIVLRSNTGWLFVETSTQLKGWINASYCR